MPRRFILSTEECERIVTYLVEGRYPQSFSKSRRKDFRKKAWEFSVHGRELLYINTDGVKQQMVADDCPEAIQRIMVEAHLPDHPGVRGCGKPSRPSSWAFAEHTWTHLCGIAKLVSITVH